MSKVTILNVLLHEQIIGTLTKLPDGHTIFIFEQSYIDDIKRATLSLSFKNRLGDLITNITPNHSKLPAFFSNLLPEGYLREYISKSAQIDEKDEFALLALLGRDLPGAVKVEPAQYITHAFPHNNKEILDDYHKNVLKFSLAGVQLKFSAFEDFKNLVIPINGMGGSWIIKLPSDRFQNIAENEFSIMTLARMIGIHVPEIRLLKPDNIAGLPQGISLSDGNVFAIKRFDRTKENSVHIEDFAQVYGVYPEYKYDKASYTNLAEVINIECGINALEEYIRRLIFNTLIGNADMHLKNWSLIYTDKINAMIAPAYDYVSTIVYLEDKTMALKYVKKKYMAELSLDLLSYLSAKARLPEKLVLNTAKETVLMFLETWHKEKNNLMLSKNNLQIIEKHFNNILLVKELYQFPK